MGSSLNYDPFEGPFNEAAAFLWKGPGFRELPIKA